MSKNRRTRVLIVAESDVLAARLEAALRAEADLQTTVGRPRALVQLIDEHDPALIVLAFASARLASELETIAGAVPVPPVIAVVDDPRAAWTATARRAGVHAVLGSDAAAEQIVAAVRAAAAGLITLHPDVFRAVTRSTIGDAGEPQPLTEREREVLQMMADGLSNRLIAGRLGISRYTVKFHVASILDKLRARTRTEAVTLGIRRGVISL